MSRISRRWRSVSFRAGLLSALSVGAVAVISVLLLVLVAFVLFSLTDGVAQISLLDRAQDQLEFGIEPEDLSLPSATALSFGSSVSEPPFWAVLENDVVVAESGDFNRAVADQPVNDEAFFSIETQDLDAGGTSGPKRVDGADWFVGDRTFTVASGREFRMVAASEGTFTLSGFFRASLPVTVPIVLLLMAVSMAATSYLTRRALRRVERMRVEVEQITRESLDRRVPSVEADDDIAKLAVTMNEMLERLEASNEQQGRFLADASHELRSPVAGLLAQLDVATAYPDTVDSATLLPKLRNEAERLQSLVNDLLFLSRSEAGEASVGERSAVDIDALLHRELEHQNLLEPEVVIKVTDTCGRQVAGSERDLERAVRNLVNNGLRHAASQVHISATERDAHVVIAVVDDGPGVPADQRERIFERFVRLDESRVRDSGGSGLGLAIVHDIATKHGGTVGLQPSKTGAHFELCLPGLTPGITN